MKTLYYTATGNSLYVAKKIGGELLSIPRLIEEGRFELEDDAIGLVYPCHGLGVPRLVLEFLAKAKLNGKYRFAVMTYGNMGAAGLSHLERAAGKAGPAFDYTNEILMVDTYLPLFDIKDQLAKEASKGIEQKLAEITADIAARKHGLIRKNLAVDILSRLTYAAFSPFAYDEADKKFQLDDKCNGCGTCARVCPRRNIAMEDKPRFQHHCDSCYACIHNCPRNALHLKSEKNSVRFRNANVQLGELIAANDRTKAA